MVVPGEPCAGDREDSVVGMTLLEILTGKGGYYPGLVPLVLVYLDSIGCDPDTASRVQAYVDLIVKRASGELQTAAAWQRDFVRSHEDYRKDSVGTCVEINQCIVRNRHRHAIEHERAVRL